MPRRVKTRRIRDATIAFNKAIEIINSHGKYGVGFADDCCALIGGTNLGYMVHKLQKVLNELTDWGKSVGLSFNEKKTVAVWRQGKSNDNTIWAEI